MAVGDSEKARPLSSKQAHFVRCMLSGIAADKAAAAVGISTRTAYRWVRDARIMAQVREADAAALAVLLRRLVALGEEALDLLSQVLSDTEAPAAVRVRAADVVLSRLVALRDVVEIEERLTALEADTFGGGGGDRTIHMNWGE